MTPTNKFNEYLFSHIQINRLKKKSDMQDMKIQELQKNIEEATSFAGEESYKHSEAKSFIKSIADQVSCFYILT